MKELENIRLKLLDESNFVPANDLDKEILPKTTGLYCIKIIDINNSGFNGEIQTAFLECKSQIIYIGKSDKSLNGRLLQELRGKGNGTFFRSIGAVLGYLPPKGSLKNKAKKPNYKFNKSDEELIINWINKYLEVSWVEISSNINGTEKELIKIYTPLFNLRDNPNKLQLVDDMRKRCIEYARN